MNKYPLKLNYIAKSAIWGGKKLSESWGKLSDGDNVAETWELTVREKEMSKITNGECAGMTLAEYISLCGEDCVSPEFSKGDAFPLLVKFIDALADLSVQVHPDDDYAGRVESDIGKTEMWYIVEAAPDAKIVYGLADGISCEDFASAVRAGEISSAMKYVPVKAGECYFIPAGMLHAIGSGILLAEIQQNSDLTYRVYDYDRVGKDGKKRELHTEKALDVTKVFSEDDVNALRYECGDAADADDELLADSKYFRVVKKDVKGASTLGVGKSFCSVLCIDGNGSIEFGDKNYEVSRGDSYFCPANMGTLTLNGEMTLICSEIRDK